MQLRCLPVMKIWDFTVCSALGTQSQTRWLLSSLRPSSNAFPLSTGVLLTQGKTTCIAAQWDEDAINVGVDLFRMLVK